MNLQNKNRKERIKDLLIEALFIIPVLPYFGFYLAIKGEERSEKIIGWILLILGLMAYYAVGSLSR